MRNLLTALFLCFAILVGIVESASGASTVHGPKTASGDFWENPNIYTYKLGSLELEPCRGDTIVGYDSATGVLYYVRQNPWTAFDSTGLGARRVARFQKALDEARRRMRQTRKHNNRKMRNSDWAGHTKTWDEIGDPALKAKYGDRADGVTFTDEGLSNLQEFSKTLPNGEKSIKFEAGELKSTTEGDYKSQAITKMEEMGMSRSDIKQFLSDHILEHNPDVNPSLSFLRIYTKQ